MCYGASQVVFKQAVVLTSLMVRVAEPGGYVLVRGVMVSLSIKEELRWWCVLTQVGDHNVIEVARRFSSVRARWGKVSLPIDGLDITRVTFHSNRLIEILSMEAITEGPTTQQDGKAAVLVLTRPTRGWVEAVVGPKAPYVDMTTVMREGFTWNSEREPHTSLPPPDPMFTMAKLRRVLTHLSAHQCCFCGDDDVLRTAKNLVYRMEQVVGTRWGRLVAGSIDAIVEYSVASATMHYDVNFLSAMAMSSAIECEKKDCPVADPTGESVKASLLRRLEWIEKAYDKARETSRAERGRSYTITAGAELTKQPYTHHQQQQRASSRSALTATELLDFLEDLAVDGGQVVAPPGGVAGWKRQRKRRNKKELELVAAMDGAVIDNNADASVEHLKSVAKSVFDFDNLKEEQIDVMQALLRDTKMSFMHPHGTRKGGTISVLDALMRAEERSTETRTTKTGHKRSLRERFK
ncbi:hypothetical protein Pmar_PMAR020365 [Perkinsus marinus ATCC 50983]|uniref:Uncharacterized protein n=1 Tax=Perkinsus marinus (strain ATCC 50983 / TXsc) TaxID=423536 RepID=C5LU48_PERM5|nr:hypothetical protein Pmar_PMAR020365 [Perkinsus marinus ATCC 50983]EEQ99744.1 hypothetical protein Pmar_PMAR020365 [Perkinsus marinus ATCC 50983]|eukprot:XP_002767027.1 hypothetical protein Pmar_PMAR020365 [Perkinsus marinus ATCC 50983]